MTAGTTGAQLLPPEANQVRWWVSSVSEERVGLLSRRGEAVFLAQGRPLYDRKPEALVNPFSVWSFDLRSRERILPLAPFPLLRLSLSAAGTAFFIRLRPFACPNSTPWRILPLYCVVCCAAAPSTASNSGKILFFLRFLGRISTSLWLILVSYWLFWFQFGCFGWCFLIFSAVFLFMILIFFSPSLLFL